MADGGTLKEKGEMGREEGGSQNGAPSHTATIAGKEGEELQCAISLFYSNPSFFLPPFLCIGVPLSASCIQ